MTKLPLAIALLAVGCAPATGPGAIAAQGYSSTACDYGPHGHLIGCYSVPMPDDVAAEVAAETPSDNPNDEATTDGLALFAPPPTADAVARALATPAVHGELDACRARFGADITSVTAKLQVAPTGEVAKIAVYDAADPLGACVARAIHDAKLGPFRGRTPVAFKQSIAL